MRRFGAPSNIDDCMKDYAVQAGSPATKVVPGNAIPLTDDEFYDQVLADNPEQGNSRFIITKAIEKTKLFQRFVGTHSTSGDRMVDTLLQNAHALLRVRGYQKIKVHQAFSALCAMVAFEGKHKLLMQVATGEGKTDISRLVASCINKLYKTKVDIATSSKTLAEEEAESSQKFYKEVGIVAQNGIDSYKSNEDKKTHVYISSDVMFGTASEFSFNILRDKLNNHRYTPDSDADKTLQSLEGKYFCDCRPGAYLIVDEVDHMFIDEKSSTCRLVSNRKEFNKFDLLACIIWTGVQELFDEIKPPTPKEAISKIIEYVEKSKVFVEKLKLKHLDLERWEACKRLYSRLAYQARFELHADVSYIVANNKITIVDVNSTGELKINSTYGRYLHTFLEMKHHLPSTRQNNCAAAKTACGFYDDYGSRIFGITGTLGGKSCIDFLKKSYGVEIIRVPKCNRNKMINYEPIPGVTPVSGCASASQELLDFCYNSLRMGRPCLVISRTIKEANELSKFVPEYIKDRYNNDLWSDEKLSEHHFPLTNLKHELYAYSTEENLSHKVKKISKDTIILGTNLASRGTDITFKGDTNSGGLSVIYTYLPVSSRVEDQIRGRGARNGDNGCNIYIAHDLPETVKTTIRDIKTGKFGGAQTVEEKKQIKSLIQNIMSKIKQLRLEQEENIMLEAYSELLLLKELDTRQSKLENTLRQLQDIERKDNEERVKKGEKELPEGSLKSVIFRSIMEEKIEIESVKEQCMGIDSQYENKAYKAKSIEELMRETLEITTYKGSNVDPRRPEDKIMVDILVDTPPDELEKKLKILKKELGNAGITEKKNIGLAIAIIQNNLGKVNEAMNTIKELVNFEVEEKMVFHTVFRLEKSISIKRSIDTIAKFCKVYFPNFVLDKNYKQGESLIVNNTQKVVQLIKILSFQYFEVDRAWENIQNCEAVMKSTESSTNEALDAHFAEYNMLKLFIGGTIIQNQKKNKKKKLVFDVAGDGIGLFGIVVKKDNKGILGYILGALMVGISIAFFLLTPYSFQMSMMIGVSCFRKGIHMIKKNYEDNKNGTYSTSDTLTEFIKCVTHVMLIPIKMIIGDVLEPITTWLSNNAEGIPVLKELINLGTKEANVLALTMKLMDDNGIFFGSDKLVKNPLEIENCIKLDDIVNHVEKQMTKAFSGWNLYSEFLRRSTRLVFTLELMFKYLPATDEALIHLAYSSSPNSSLEEREYFESFAQYYSALMSINRKDYIRDRLAFIHEIATKASEGTKGLNINEGMLNMAINKFKQLYFDEVSKRTASSFLCREMEDPFKDMVRSIFTQDYKGGMKERYIEDDGIKDLRKRIDGKKAEFNSLKAQLDNLKQNIELMTKQITDEVAELEKLNQTRQHYAKMLGNYKDMKLSAKNKGETWTNTAEGNSLEANCKNTSDQYLAKLAAHRIKVSRCNEDRAKLKEIHVTIINCQQQLESLISEHNRLLEDKKPQFVDHVKSEVGKLGDAVYEFLKLFLTQLIADLKSKATKFVDKDYAPNVSQFQAKTWSSLPQAESELLSPLRTSLDRHFAAFFEKIKLVSTLRELFVTLKDLFHEQFSDRMTMIVFRGTKEIAN